MFSDCLNLAGPMLKFTGEFAPLRGVPIGAEHRLGDLGEIP
jgi:hypothetical protein